MPSSSARVLVARIGAPHGVRGEVRLFSFTEDPEAVRTYRPLTDASGARTFRILSLRAAKDHFVARLEGVADRNAAEALTNLDLYVPREALPAAADEDTFYHADLIGLRVEDEAGAEIGRVVALHDFGAGDILEYAPRSAEGAGKTVMVPFTKAAVPVVDVAAGRLVVTPLALIEGEEDAGKAQGENEVPSA